MEVVTCYDAIKKKNGNNTAKKLFTGPCNEDGDNFSVVENLKSSPLEIHFTPVSAIQCCGSGSIGSVFLGLLDPDPDPLVRGMDLDPSIIKQK
jgi:hypothetical protein